MSITRASTPLQQFQNNWTPEKIKACKDLEFLLDIFIESYALNQEGDRQDCLQIIKRNEQMIHQSKNGSGSGMISCIDHLKNKVALIEERTSKTLSILKDIKQTKVMTAQQRGYLLSRYKELVGWWANGEESPTFHGWVLDHILQLASNKRQLSQRFLLIGLPGTGKTSSLLACTEILRRQGINCQCLSTDELIRARFKANDPVIQAYETAKGIHLSHEIFAAEKPTAKFIELYGEEPAFRDLEAMFVIDILKTVENNSLIDFGGKAVLRDNAYHAAMIQKIIPIFLYAEHTTILNHLAVNESWRNRSNYALAHSDGTTWPQLAEIHRRERLESMMQKSVIIIATERNTEECFRHNSRFTPKNTKLPAEISKEILMRIKELELSCQNRTNTFVTKQMKFFKSSPVANQSISHSELKAALEKDLHFKKATV